MKSQIHILLLITTLFTGSLFQLNAQQKLFAGRVNNFSTVYDVYPYGWSGYQILGKPNVYPNYGDIPDAFNPLQFGAQRDFIELGFDNNGPIDSIFIYQTYTPGFVDSVFVKNPGTLAWDLVYSAIAAPTAPVATMLEIGFPMTSYTVKEVRFTLANDTATDWVEIDAVAISPATTNTFVPETTPGSSYNFDGVNTVYHTYSSLLNLITDTGATFTAWINVHQNNAPAVIDVFEGSGILCDADGTYLGIYLGNTGGNDSIYFYNYDGANEFFGMDFTPDTWFHIAWIHSNGLLKAYKNGILYRTIPSGTTAYIGMRPLEMGFNLTTGNYFEGEMDEVATFNRGLNATEVYNVMHMNTVGIIGMTGYWQMSNCDEQHFYNPLNYIADSLNLVNCTISGVPNFIGNEIISEEYSSIHLFPNPSNGILNIQLINIDSKFLIIYDVTGRAVYQSNSTGDDLITLNLQNLSNGIYSVQVIDTNRNTHVSRLIKN